MWTIGSILVCSNCLIQFKPEEASDALYPFQPSDIWTIEAKLNIESMNNYKFGTRLISAFCVASDVKHGISVWPRWFFTLYFWFCRIRVPWPFQWGAPSFDAGEAFAMMMASFVALVEVCFFSSFYFSLLLDWGPGLSWLSFNLRFPNVWTLLKWKLFSV